MNSPDGKPLRKCGEVVVAGQSTGRDVKFCLERRATSGRRRVKAGCAFVSLTGIGAVLLQGPFYGDANEVGEGDYPYPTAREFIRQAVELVGAEKLLWGTDIPSLLATATYPQPFRFVARHCDFLSDEDRANILGDNALRAYGGA